MTIVDFPNKPAPKPPSGPDEARMHDAFDRMDQIKQRDRDALFARALRDMKAQEYLDRKQAENAARSQHLVMLLLVAGLIALGVSIAFIPFA